MSEPKARSRTPFWFGDGHTLAAEVESYRQLFNQVRPHEALGIRRPLDVHFEAINDRQTTKSTEPETLPLP